MKIHKTLDNVDIPLKLYLIWEGEKHQRYSKTDYEKELNFLGEPFHFW